jgi:predicted aspartyl protease
MQWRFCLVLLLLLSPAWSQEAACPAREVGDVTLFRIGERTALPLPGFSAFVPYVPVTLNGAQKYMLLDTGAARSALSATTANELKLTRLRAESAVVDVSGRISRSSARLERFSVGALLPSTRSFMVLEGNEQASDVAGLLGQDWLGAFDFELDLAHDRLRLYRPGPCATPPAGFTQSIPVIVDESGHIVLTVTLDGVNLKAVLDTGSSQPLLNRSIAEREFAGRENFRLLEIGPLKIAEPKLRLADDRMQGALAGPAPSRIGRVAPGAAYERRLPDMVLGMSVFDQMRFFLDGRRKRLYLAR